MASDPDARLAALGTRQHGLVTAAQERAVGLTPKQVKTRVAAGRLEVVTRGVHAFAGSPDTWQRRALAAQLAVADVGGVVSHITAAAVHGLLRPSPLPHVTVPPGSSARCPIAKVHRSVVPGIDRITVDGIRVTSASRTVVDVAAVGDRPMLEAVMDDALCRGLVSPESLLAAADRAPIHRRGRGLLLSAVEIWTEAIEPDSPGEVRLLRGLAGRGLPSPVTQFEVYAPDGTFVARVDAAWPDDLVALEYLGRRVHGPRAVDHDELRRRRLVALGWRVAEATKVDLQPGETALFDRLASWLGVRQGPAEGPLRSRRPLAHAVPLSSGLS